MTGSAWALSIALAAACCVRAQDTSTSILDRFPEGEGREEVTSTCSACHTLSRVAANHRTRAQWTQTIKIHENRGLKLEPDESAPIAAYLGAYFGPIVNLNTATAAEIAELPSVSKKMAEDVVDYRSRRGPFRDPAEVSKVPGFSPGLMAKIKNRLSTGEESKER